ncbi:lytic transglycosylase domain-containing protein [Cytophagaceae bacterium ABcell3]|nr:lytic transglycosylase domain-containing protein [Cytophagaceae bacterium ABcell3]
MGFLIVLLLNSKSNSDQTVVFYDIEFIPEIQMRHQVLNPKIPDDVTFSGETVHFNSPEAYLKFERELRLNASNNSSTRLLLKNVRVWLPEITKILVANKIPEDFKFVAVAESNLSNVVSPRGAAGFWQITDITALHLGLELNDEVDERYNPIKATRAACRYFKEGYRVFGNWTSAAASYNRGINGLKRAYKTQKVKNYYELSLNDETSRYLYKILAIKDLVNNPEKYSMKPIGRSQLAYKTMVVDYSIPDLKAFALHHNIDYELFREYNPWILKNSLTIKQEGKTYTLFIPRSPEYLFKNEVRKEKESDNKDA